jgi:uncharacterized protein YcbK (DUF882 family)
MKRVALNRRDFLKKSVAGTLAAIAFPNVLPASSKALREVRRLELYNIHTGEFVRATYWAEGEYIAEELERLSHLLRDYRTGDVHPMDRRLFDLLHTLQACCRSPKPYHVISGYRSPFTNEMLRRRSRGVAKRSLHMQGRAIDINLPGVSLKHLHHAALSLRKGGVGYYPKSGFVHVDTGRVRHWRG